ncbi:hypothetical protein BH09ACT8_BH09ACT8_57520 [soil metagenome]
MAAMTDNQTDNQISDISADPIDVESDDDEARAALAIREVLERQLAAGQALSRELLDVASVLTAAVVEAPAAVVGAVRGGATLPAAFTQSGSALRGVVADAGDRTRSAIGEYISGQAVLPNAVIEGAAEVTGSVVRAQGRVVTSAVDAAFSVATVANQGGELRDSIEREWRELAAAATSARQTVGHKVESARQGVREAISV